MSVTLRDGRTVDDPRLDRLPSVRTDHLQKYPLTAATLPDRPTPMAMGVNWYSNFDSPVARRINGRDYMVIGDGNLGRIRGGHATCLRPWTVADALSWWAYYNQGVEGRCVEFACLRLLSLMNRYRYDITSRWHYWQMQRGDEWAGGSYPGASPHYEGTSVRSGLEVLHRFGAIRALPRGAAVDPDRAPGLVRPEEGIAAYRWALNWADVRTVLGVPDWLPGVPMLNSWGRGYPRQVILLDAAGERIQREDGELGVVTDR
jgi:hypothetical protein